MASATVFLPLDLWRDDCACPTARGVMATEYSVDPIQDELLCVITESIVLRGEDERAAHVHFPRLGFCIMLSVNPCDV